ncbi:hypothetical protein C7974DRAFT_403598 [Boeremia exigua]|uniref:uncharacterized protein n=1 Tax=Boeremia exigua TaxID=749465 RepID=UPI001E8EBC71|nr:uncharacterized protein C7974DRAFT_403598 [Boeremia exigua]KAH6615271.1 hypothetical protein C7974DRAFT_403598 [Boeremia exigua]
MIAVFYLPVLLLGPPLRFFFDRGVSAISTRNLFCRDICSKFGSQVTKQEGLGGDKAPLVMPGRHPTSRQAV